ncbi:uncharacterized protein MELLADRAFT_113447 [Melampsora larici-populina 98AG31]|uniref:DH domain-containing protein n=1 Tax=Melampsora larici-populina (strain 98AG31 / pathotype 3-4-7) TaxID=747676 RepID=F4SA03_MELLP|nr:uncharacterized protein MELLADRAFT_113447 [Melampsora larici-populina 98AG31]EGF98559.1 hypothetical protein MELLADRAFT_113447 [Melampsora larici-populina 98AG31]
MDYHRQPVSPYQSRRRIPISSFAASTPNLSHFPSINSIQTTQSKPSLLALSKLNPLIPIGNHPPTTTKSTLVDVVVEGMGGGTDPGEGWQVPPGDRLDPFVPTQQPGSSSTPFPHTKSLTAALNHATSRPETDHKAILALFTELVITERTYLRRITALNQSYGVPLRQFSSAKHTKIIEKYEATTMFGKIESLVKASTNLLAVLERSLEILQKADPATAQHSWSEEIASELLHIQRPYRDYLGSYDTIKETEQKLKRTDGFRQFCERTKEAMYDEGMGRVGLRELLMEPVQRVTRYILIFEQILKKMSSGDPSRSGLLDSITTCNRLAICELDDHLIKAATMWGLSRAIDHFPAILVKPGRHFIDSIDVLDVFADATTSTVLHCTLFLFNDTIVIAKKPHNSLSGRILAGLDDLDRLTVAMKKSKAPSSLNSVVSGGTDFLAKSLGGSNHHGTPSKLRKGSMRFKGLIDVHDVIASNGIGGGGPGGEVGFDLFLTRPPQDVSDRWSDRPLRHYLVCAPSSPAHEKSHSLSFHPPSSHVLGASHHHSHSLSSRTHHTSQLACLAERDRFLGNLRKAQALVKAVEDRSTVMRTKFLSEPEGHGTIENYWNLYDKRTYMSEQRKHRVVLQLVGTDSVDPLPFNPEPDLALPPMVIIRASFNDPDDPDCVLFPFCPIAVKLILSYLLVVELYKMADIPSRPYSSSTNRPASVSSPSRGFRSRAASSSTATSVNSNTGAQRLFGNPNAPLTRTRSVTTRPTSSKVPAVPTIPDFPNAAVKSPGGPVWFLHNKGEMDVMPEDDQEYTIVGEKMKKSDSNPSLYEEQGEGSDFQGDPPSPSRSTIKGKQRSLALRDETERRCGVVEEDEEGEEEEEEEEGNGSDDGSSVSGLSSSCGGREDDEDEDEEIETPRKLRGPRQIVSRVQSRNVSASSIGKRTRSMDDISSLNVYQGEDVGEEEVTQTIKRVAGMERKREEELPGISPILSIRNHLKKVEQRSPSAERRREERKVLVRRRRNKENEKMDIEDLKEVILEDVDGTEDLFRNMHGKIKEMKGYLSRLKSLNMNINESNTSTIPRSPRKAQLMALVSQPMATKEDCMSGIKKGLDGMEDSLKIGTNQIEEMRGLIQEYQEIFQSSQIELTKTKNELIQSETSSKLIQSLHNSLEVENCHLYEAFNEELDKMYNDIQLPVGQAFEAIVEDLKKMAEEKGRLVTQLGSTKRKLEMESARANCYEEMLKSAGLLNSTNGNGS